jgi:drug/metabolite transporter (DMT)-like permease
MFIVGGAVLGLLFLHEPLTLRKAIGVLLAIASIYLVAGQAETLTVKSEDSPRLPRRA